MNVCKIKALSDLNAPSDTPRSSIVNTISRFFQNLAHIILHTTVIAEALVLADLGNTLRLVREILSD